MRSEAVRVHAALITVSLIYGYFYVAVKLLLKTLTPAEFILLRFILTAVMVILIDLLFLKHALPKGKDLFKIIGLGLVGVFVVQILVVFGLHHTTAFHSALIMATIPIITLIFSILNGMETFHFQKLMGIITGFSGVTVLLFFSSSPNSPLPSNYLMGDFIVFLNALAFSWFLLGSQKMLQKYQSFPFMAYCYIVSASLFSLIFFTGHFATEHSLGLDFLKRIGLHEWLSILYVVLFASIGSYTLNNYALKRVSPSIVAIYMFIQPIISAATGFYLLGEPFNIQMAIATIITFAGVLMATTVGKKGFYLRKPSVSHLEEECLAEEEPPKNAEL
jgi:drug/metabolite transporter (DMT)-like permease